MKYPLLLLSLFISVSLLAAQLGSNVKLVGGNIEPKQVLAISLADLNRNVRYMIACHIKDENNINNQAFLYVDSPVSIIKSMSLNGVEVKYQMKLPQINNVLVLNSIYGYYETIRITNLDDENKLVVSDCVASVES